MVGSSHLPSPPSTESIRESVRRSYTSSTSEVRPLLAAVPVTAAVSATAQELARGVLGARDEPDVDAANHGLLEAEHALYEGGRLTSAMGEKQGTRNRV